jgi:integrase
MERRSIMRRVETGIYQMDDGRYRVRTTGRSPVGKMLQREATVESLEDARAARDSLKAEIRHGQSMPREETVITVADYAARWLSQRARRLKPSTLAGYEEALALRILPLLGHLRISAITRHDIEGWVAWAESQRKPPQEVQTLRQRIGRGSLPEDEGERMIADIMRTATGLEKYATDSLRAWYRVLGTMMRDAHADGYLADDPTRRVRPPSTGVKRRREHRTLSALELGRLIDAARAIHPGRYAEIVTLAYTGMRAGELYGLSWEDVDFAGQRLHVRRAVSKGKLGPTKTGDPREVPMPEVVADALRSHLDTMIREQRRGLEEGLVFPSTTGGYRVQSSITKPLLELAEHVGIEHRVSPQVLRRTFNTLLVMEGVDRIAIRAMMGHMDEEMTERYAGVRMDRKLDAVVRLVGKISNEKG